MGAKTDEEYARRLLAVIAFAICLVGFGVNCAALGDLSWSHYAENDGIGSFGLWRYRFTIRNVTREGAIQSHDPTALCNLGIYNSSRTRAKEHDRVPGRWKDDCDDMIDACGLGINCGVLAAGFSLGAAALAVASGFVADDKPSSTGGVVTYGAGRWQWPAYSTLGLVSASCSVVFGFLAIWAYATMRPSSPNKFLRDYDTPGANRTWRLGKGFYTMLAGAFIMGLACMVLVSVQNSKKIFLTGAHKEISSSLLSEAEVGWEEEAGTERGATVPL